MNTNDTIVALATPPGRGGVAMIRISGPLVQHISTEILKQSLSPRIASLQSFFDTDDSILDQGIALLFPHPHSFTGEDVLELHAHGGPVIVDLLLRRVISLGARLARPGEFSERAFLNNKIDLTQAEAIADLINATSEQAARLATRSLQGDFSKKIHALVEALIHLRSYVEASIDFVDEEIDFLDNDNITKQLEDILNELKMIQANAQQGSFLREGITAVIAGKPNVGKSSLLNCLSGKELAIVTDIPGTTRDILRDYILIDGMPVHIIDTAGLRESDDIVEQEGIRRAHHEITQADLVLLVEAATEPTDLHDISYKNLLIIRNKIDLTGEPVGVHQVQGYAVISVSVKKNLGIDLLREQIKQRVGYHGTHEGIFLARRRHLDALARATTYVEQGWHELTGARAGELLAENLRQAQQCLAEITGEFTSDDLLGRIFSSFCIGK